MIFMTASQKKLTACPIQTTCSEWFLFYHKPGADPPDQEKTRRGSGRNRASRPEVPGYGQPASRIPCLRSTEEPFMSTFSWRVLRLPLLITLLWGLLLFTLFRWTAQLEDE